MSAFKHRVGRLGARAVLLASVSVMMLAIGALGASGASAAGVCTGSNIKGEGASLQGKAQSVWNAGFNTNGAGCVGGPTVTYTATGSGAGLEAFGLNNHALKTEDVYVSSDDAPNAGQLEEMRTRLREEGATHPNTTDLAVFPVTQTAIAIVAHLPSGCTLTQIRNADLEAVFRGTKRNWSEITGQSGCTGTITRIVRKDASGSTYQFKHYLHVLHGTKDVCTGKLGEVTWQELQNNSKVKVGEEEVLPNTTWPTCGEATNLETPTGTGGSELVKKVNAKAGSIGYAALADAENPANQTAGTLTILKVQNSGLPTFASPVGSGSNAACTETEYANRPKNLAGTEFTTWEEAETSPLNLDWSSVYGSNPTISGTKYPICTLTWSIAASESTAVFGAASKTTVIDYQKYVLANAGGVADLSGNWYAPVPANPLTVAEAAVNSIT